MFTFMFCCLLNQKFERLGGHLGEIVTVSVWFLYSKLCQTQRHLIQDAHWQDIACFIFFTDSTWQAF